MKNATRFFLSDVNFGDSLPGLITDSLVALLKTNFPGRDYFISLYSKQNGGYFDCGAYIHSEDPQERNSTDRDRFEVEAFNFIPTTKNEKSWRLPSTAQASKFREVHYKLSTTFLSHHILFASDDGDNNFWLDTETGIIPTRKRKNSRANRMHY
ncbi:hypothetical protein HFK18_20230|uniref:hypothetical protein n=1 Tax=Stenotrophomonas TaxID=40323 RepID=UPI0015D2D997|nr:hypothetical protein [Stenotrophomonas sp. SbOxS2]NYU00796.1 hypothetical protein [Stenotrophomonas sp. SbOxS2]